MGTHAASIELVVASPFTASRRDWLRIAVVAIALIMIASLAFALDQVLPRPVPLALSLHESVGQLRIAWNPLAAAHGATLQILDGGRQTTLMVAAPLADITYAAETADVQVRLTTSDDGRMEIARYLVQVPTAAEVAAQFTAVFAEAHSIRRAIRRENLRISMIQSAAKRLSGRTRAAPKRVTFHVIRPRTRKSREIPVAVGGIK